MNFVILGAGAMGSLFGGYLAEAGVNVTLVDINEAHIEAIKKNGLQLDRGDGPRTVRVNATTDPTEVAPADMVIVFCKYLSTDRALNSARPYLRPSTYIWTLQNGIGNVEIIEEHASQDRIAKGFTSATGIILGPGMVGTNFKGQTETYYWPLDGERHEALESAAELLTNAGLPTYSAPDMDYRIWRKLVINTTLTVLSGAMNTRIGAVYFNAAGKTLCRAIVEEVVAVAQAAGVPLEMDDALAYLDQLANSAVDHIGSTTVSLQKHELTEIDTMNGAVVREGRKRNVPTPVNETIARMIKLTEETSSVRLQPSI
ncbi:MAG: ketopantoate reductase family protein [Gammaproteobacteria bacterium]|nr:ketopantoate reductase family protein [Gammaproteobacteria bacterium]